MLAADASTRDQILAIASEVFYRKGLHGARMQEIADQAGLNKAMLHYYFKTKEQLFDTVFQRALGLFLGGLAPVLSNSELGLQQKIAQYVNYTIDALAKNPAIAAFIAHELQQHPERLAAQFGNRELLNLDVFRQQLATGRSRPLAPHAAEHLFANMVALCVYPVLAQPLLRPLLHQTEAQYHRFLQERKAVVTLLLLEQL